MQLALEPLWKAYEVLERGADHKAMLLSMAKRLDLKQVLLLPEQTVDDNPSGCVCSAWCLVLSLLMDNRLDA